MVAFPRATADGFGWPVRPRLPLRGLALAGLAAAALLAGPGNAGGNAAQADPAGETAAAVSPIHGIDLFAETNAQRAAAGLPALLWDAELAAVAQERVDQMATRGYFGHVDPDGVTMYTELLEGAAYRYDWAGENLARNNFPAGSSVDEAIRALMVSPSHRENILANEFNRAGVAAVTTPEGVHLYAMIFASR